MKRSALVRQPKEFRSALYEPCSQFILQLSQTAGERRFRHPNGPVRTSNPPIVSDLLKGNQRQEVRLSNRCDPVLDVSISCPSQAGSDLREASAGENVEPQKRDG